MDFSHYLRDLLNPSSIALIGASEKKGSFGTLLWNNLNNPNNKAKLFAVNPKYKTVGETKCYSSLTSIRSNIDLAIVVSPPSSYEKILQNCIQKKIPNLLLCGGFPRTELTPKIFDLIDQCIEDGIKVLGPQSLGFVRSSEGINASFLPKMPPSGDIGLVSQSPGLICSMIDFVTSSRCGFSYIVDPGMERSLTPSDFVDLLATDNETKCIVLYLESFTEPRRLLSAIRLASRHKPVIVLKGGRTPASSDIIINNSGAKEDEEGVMEKALIRSGALLVNSLTELYYAIQLFAFRRDLQQGAFYGIVNSKGLDSLLADHAFNNGLTLAHPDSNIADVLNQKFHILYPYANPINVGLNMPPKEVASLLEFLLSLPECSGVLLAVSVNPVIPEIEIAKAILPVIQQSDKLVITSWMGGESVKAATQMMRDNGVPAINDLEDVSHTVYLAENFLSHRLQTLQIPKDDRLTVSEDFSGARKIIQKALKAKRHLLYEEEAKRLLASIGFETTMGIYAGSIGEAIEAVKSLGYPVAMKIRADGVLSKSDNGGVIIGIRNERELRTAWKDMKERADNLLLDKTKFAVYLQKTLEINNKRELRIGIKRTRDFGPIIYLSIGGMYGKLFGETIFDFAPLTENKARAMLETKPFKTFLGNYKGLPEANKKAIIIDLLRLSDLAVQIPALHSLEIDPLLCGQKDVIVLDSFAVISNEPLDSSENAEHLIFATRLPNSKAVEGDYGRLTLKVAQSEDAPAFMEYLEGLSDNTKHLRFHSPTPSPEPIVLSAITSDPDRSFSVFLVDENEDKNEVIAEAQFSILPNQKDAEFGISVRDDWQKKGLSSILMTSLETEAKKRGLERLIGYVLKDNGAMSTMMKKRGYSSQTDDKDEDINLFILELDKGKKGK